MRDDKPFHLVSYRVGDVTKRFFLGKDFRLLLFLLMLLFVILLVQLGFFRRLFIFSPHRALRRSVARRTGEGVELLLGADG
uniref:hypothetical protein n=1 Tax=Acidocella sp. C78 TaxID=1671486 RepID=UPI001BD6364D|nr:hypothetical protein [Acidocella sp. C78]